MSSLSLSMAPNPPPPTPFYMYFVAGLVLIPLSLALACLFLALLLVYLCTLVGPLYHVYIATPHEEAMLRSFANSEILHDVGFFPTATGKRLFYRYTSHEPTKQTPILLVQGLGSTVVNTCFLHDALVGRGFRVLSYDRLGTGLSDSPLHPQTPSEHIDQMAALLDHVASHEAFGLFAGSFGNTVAQLFTAKFPHKVAFVLNLDGLPYTLGLDPAVCQGFSRVEQVYAAESVLSRLGVLRPILALALPRVLAKFGPHAQIPPAVVAASFQSARLLEGIRDEVMLMMEVGRAVDAEWGPLSIPRLPDESREQLAALRGDVIVPEEPGLMREPREEMARFLRTETPDADLALPRRWKQIPVCSMSCRDYSYDPYELFLTANIKRQYVAEHNFLALVAKPGSKRIEFTNESHLTGVFLGDALFDQVEALDAECCADGEVGVV